SALPSTAFFASSVRMVPGPIAFTRMPWGASDSAITLVSWLMAPLETTYGTWLGMASTAFTLDMLMIAPPPPCFTIWRAAAWPARNTPFRFTARTRSKSTSSMSRNSAAWTMPALATRMSRRPNFSTVAATARSTLAFLDTSHAVPAADLPTLPAAAWTAPSLRSTSMTFAPSATKAWAQANPIPCAAPVTSATLSRSFMRLFADGLHRVEVHRRIARLGGTGGGPDRVHEFGAELVLHRGAVL